LLKLENLLRWSYFTFEQTLCWYVSVKHVFTFLIFKRKANYTSFLIAYFLSIHIYKMKTSRLTRFLSVS